MSRRSVNFNKSNFSGNLVQGNVQGNVECTFSEDIDMNANENEVYNVGQAGAVGRYSRSDNNTFIQPENERTLTEAATEIHNLLRYLERTNPTATQEDKISYVNDETTPGFKRRFIGALKAGGDAALEEIVDNAYVNVFKEIVQGWLNPE